MECWQAARAFRREVYRLSRLPEFSHDFALIGQIRRAAISVGSNIAEGFERGGNRELMQFLSNAKGSAGETKDQLYVALDESYITREQFDAAYAMGDSTSRLVGGFMSYLRRSPVTGYKFDSVIARANPKPKTQNSKP
ncbi:MAG TPA: four helix bundle protein [Opitutaceae bacterium]|nr:four helix bundle protein [Opitutaceae bacterium]